MLRAALIVLVFLTSIFASMPVIGKSTFDRAFEFYNDKNYKVALESFKASIAIGEDTGKSQFFIGQMYYYGNGIEKNYTKAREYYQKSAEANIDGAYYMLGNIYYSGIGVEVDYLKAKEWFLKAAKQNIAGAQYFLGVIHRYGKGVEKNNTEAHQWFSTAAVLGSNWGKYELARSYHYGWGVDKDIEKAIKWYSQSADDGFLQSQKELAKMYRNGWGVEMDIPKSVIYFKQAAAQGDSDSLLSLARIYFKGNRGVPQNVEEGLRLYNEAINKDHLGAENELANIYLVGRNVTQDIPKGLALLNDAVDAGYINAIVGLAKIYHTGNTSYYIRDRKEVLTPNPTKALELFKQAYHLSENKLTYEAFISAYSIAELYESDKNSDKDMSQSIQWYERAIKSSQYAKKSNYTINKKKGVATQRVNELLCQRDSSSLLFNVLMNCADRDELRAAIKGVGATVIKENNNNWGDTYNSSNILQGTSQLYVGYEIKDSFAIAQYTFPANMDTQKVVEVKNFVANKYGEPTTSSGRINVGEVSYQWKLKDGISIEVSRGWPSTTTYLTFKNPKNYDAMKAEQKKQAEAKKAKEYEKQSNAF